jgi:membrane associated rhomboid family serine protease
MTTTESPSGQPADIPGCYRHPRRETYVRCVRCDRYICGDCTRSAAVGQQCVECVRDGNKTVRRARTIAGGRIPSTAVATYSLIIVNVLAYVAELASPGIVDRFSTLGEGLMRNGQLYTYSGRMFPGFQAVGIAHGEWYRLATGAFLHLPPTQGAFGITHIIFNMWWLWVLGRAIEPLLGSLRFTAVYLLAAVGGSVLGYLLAPDTSAIGASGAIFGLAAAYFVLSRRLNVDASYAARLVGIFLVWLVVSAGLDFSQGHLGGFLAGGAITLAYAYSPARQRTVIQLAATAGMLVIFAAAVVLRTHQLTG